MLHRHMRTISLSGLVAGLAMIGLWAAACQESGIPAPPVPPPITRSGSAPIVARPTPIQKSVTGYRDARFEPAIQKGQVFAIGNVVSAAGVPGSKALRMDIYTPTGHDARDKPAAFIVANGAAGDGEALARYLTARGFVSFVAQVRGAEDNPPYPDAAPIVDARAGLRWVHAHAEQFGIGARRIAIVGVGAAASTAVRTALSDPESNIKDEPSSSGFDQHPLNPFNSPDASAVVRAAAAAASGAVPLLQTGGTGDALGEPILDFLVKNMVEDRTYYCHVDVPPVANGKTKMTPGGGYYREGTKVSLSPEADPGYRFMDYKDQSGKYVSGNNLTIDGDLNLTQRFAPLEPQSFAEIEVKVQGSGRALLDPPGGKYLKDTWVRLYKLPDPGMQHLAVLPSIPQHLNYMDLLANQNSSITIVFQKSSAAGPFTLETSADGEGSVALDPPGGSYPAGTVVTATANPGAGKSFLWWAGDTRQAAPKATIIMDANKKLTAGFGSK